ncbi:MAG: site-specific DNA-methyltransferase, partial [Kiritimatiellaeota bacterium]|nr:site-specific DNA-methyltransferase [Kiritimatiellota bacterium]
YQAQPIQGEYVHGKKGGALVMVGAVDAPVTISQINDGLAECALMEREELHVLGWEWEMGMNDPIIKQARTDGVRLRLLNIPREVMEKRAVECGDIRFFDLAFLEAEVKPVGKKMNKITIELTDFVIPDTELIPEDVRAKITKWSDYVDYWAVDWDFRHDTFMNQWQTYRTRKNRKLELVSEEHKYEEPGVYRILIKVVDIFGNDTSRMLEWEVPK